MKKRKEWWISSLTIGASLMSCGLLGLVSCSQTQTQQQQPSSPENPAPETHPTSPNKPDQGTSTTPESTLPPPPVTPDKDLESKQQFNIANYADFVDQTTKTLTIPAQYTCLTGHADFSHADIQKIVIKGSVKVIPANTFLGLKTLQSIEFGPDLQEIGIGAFNGCSMLEITIPKSVVKLDDNCLNGVLKVSFEPNSKLNTIGDNAFCNGKFTSIQLPETVTQIGTGAFQNCSNLKSIQIPSKIKVLFQMTFSNCRALESIVLPNQLMMLGSNCFNNCFQLKTIVLPNSLEVIGASCFAYCKALSSIAVPNGILAIGANVFVGCNQLNDIHLPSVLNRPNDYGPNGNYQTRLGFSQEQWNAIHWTNPTPSNHWWPLG